MWIVDGRGHSSELGVDGKVILKFNFIGVVSEVVHWLRFAHCNEFPGFVLSVTFWPPNMKVKLFVCTSWCRILSLGAKWRWVAIFMPNPPYPRIRILPYPLNSKSCGPQNRFNALEKTTFAAVGKRIGLPLQCVDWALPLLKPYVMLGDLICTVSVVGSFHVTWIEFFTVSATRLSYVFVVLFAVVKCWRMQCVWHGVTRLWIVQNFGKSWRLGD